MSPIGGIGGSAMDIAVLGMVLAQQRLDSSAGVIAGATLPGTAPAATGGSAGGDIELALVDQLQAVTSFGLNAAVARSADDLTAETIRLADGTASA